MGLQPQDLHKLGHGNGLIEIFLKSLARIPTGLLNQVAIALQMLQKIDNTLGIATIKDPTAFEFLNIPRNRRLPRTNKQHRPPRSHQAVGLAGDDAAEGGGELCDESDMALGEVVAEGFEGGVRLGDGIGEPLKLGLMRAASREGEADVLGLWDDVEHRLKVVCESEVAGVEHVDGAAFGSCRHGEGADEVAVGPIFDDVDLGRVNAVTNEPFTHAFAEGDDAGVRHR